ncbi:hypothetical protein DPMN_072799 [Dreissena polymorpha]|uniref:Uncharacterized protein n=1 Tax=Dreissena polymorpha TaxID=45954 RepID=A0A9D4BXZ6_DREPO|nr:hypothetical protein DPMN_072799 [Dreissena polymorpha]
MCKLISKEGKDDVQHKRPIDTEDIKKLYSSLAFDINTPTGLLNKVWFELCMHFCRRWRENQREMRIDMFEFHYDDKGLEYVLQRSEQLRITKALKKQLMKRL